MSSRVDTMAVGRRLFLLVVTALACAPPAAAQGRSDPFDTARFRFGPVAFTPRLAVKSLGIDTNVFNEIDDPKRDITAMFGPQVAAWLRLGRGRLTATSDLDYVYFKWYATERSLNTYNDVRVELPLNRLTPYVSERFVNARERLGFEIDARARHKENALTVGVDLRTTSRTTVGLSAQRRLVGFDADAVFLGTNLSEVLNRKEEVLSATLRHSLTPLTTFVVAADARRDRFDLSPVRDADSVRVSPGLEFDAFAVVNGSAYVGYRKFDALGAGVPSFRGVVASVDLRYTLLSITRVAVRAERDVAYSFEPTEPYYVLNGATASVTQKIATTWDVQARAGRQRLDYRRIGTVASTAAGRRDRVETFGGSVGYTVGRTTRLGANLDYYRRRTGSGQRDYQGLRAYTSVTYGF